MKLHYNQGRKQTSEQIRKRVESTARTKAAWTKERYEEYINKVREANRNRDPSWREKNAASHRGKTPWNKGEKCPQLSGSNHWNWGGNMPQKSIEKMRKSLIGKKQSPETIRKRFDTRTGYKHSPETKIKIGKANAKEANGNWLGGIGCEPYAPIWIDKRFKIGIRERDNHICQNPDCRGNCDVLAIHHIDYDKKNCEPENLITLCRSCNGRANFNREFWEAGYKEIIRMKYQADEQRIAS